QVEYSNIPGQSEPVQPLDVLYAGVYAQDEWRPIPNLTLTGGLRIDAPKFDNTAYDNPVADTMAFRDASGAPVHYSSGSRPGVNLLISPRLDFNYDLHGEQKTQIRGGTGIFTGRPAYVWISNQIGNTGVLTGFIQADTTTAFPFSPNPDAHKPANVTGAPATTFALALTDPNFKFPQLWRSNIGVDQRLPWGLTGTAEFLYSKDVNGIAYINANLPAVQAAFSGPDSRPRCGVLAVFAGPPALRGGHLQPRLYGGRPDERGPVHRGAQRRQRQLCHQRRHEWRWRDDQRPDLHPAQHERDELRFQQGDRRQRHHHLHSRATGGGVGCLHFTGPVSEEPPRGVRAAQRGVSADGVPGRPEHLPGRRPEHRGPAEPAPGPARHPERHQPARPQLGRRPGLRHQPAAELRRGRRHWRADVPVGKRRPSVDFPVISEG